MILTLFFLLPMLLTGYPHQPPTSSITRHGMTVSWCLTDGVLDVTLEAPTTGWVAVGFNTQNALTGTSLIMGCVNEGKPLVADHYVRQPGDYPAVVSLGGQSALAGYTGSEADGRTRISFTLTAAPAESPFHHRLSAGQAVYLLMAYSHEDDFRHHSAMRTTVLIHL